jgi:phosphoribosylformylglycinamidine synthase
MALLAVDEALRNVICVGADPEHTAILDNFCWPKVDSEESMGALVRACVGAKDAALAYGLPFISGKDSLNNQFSMSAEEAKRTGLPQQLAIPPTLLISAVGIVPDVRRCVTMDLKEPGNVLVLPNANVNVVGLEPARKLHHAVSRAIRGGLVRAAHDVGDGGLAVAVAEMCIASGFGVELKDHSFIGCFYESPTFYLLEVAEGDLSSLSMDVDVIGRVTADARLKIGKEVDLTVGELARAWREPLMDGGSSS